MDKLRVGILGLRRGRTHLHNFLRLDNCQVIAVADRIEASRERDREQVEAAGGRVLAEYDDLLALKPDAVVVASNARLQVAHACQALEAGCAVLSEIPGAFTPDDLLTLKSTVERTGGYYMAAENTCFYDFLPHWRKWLIEGRLGEPSVADGEYLHSIRNSLVTPDGRYLSPTAARAEGVTDTVPSWRAAQPPIQYLTHDLGPLLEVLDDRVVSVSCRSSAWRCADTPLRPDAQIALFETAGGVLIKIMVALSPHLPSEHRYRLLGTGGSAEWFFYEDHGRLFDAKRTEAEGWQRLKIGLAAATDDTSTGHGGVDLKVAKTFADALLAGRPSPIDVYRMIEYSLPGMVAAKSAEQGGAPLPVPDLRRDGRAGTRFWDYVGLPEGEAEEV
ncbi:MAG: Gfo/Idh/MocA family oxidoreductase [Armatimonadetes bacterium]|nr:Gfo/Idh/MocA family oxidoreductase [Armatimonadota bacterium]